MKKSQKQRTRDSRSLRGSIMRRLNTMGVSRHWLAGQMEGKCHKSLEAMLDSLGLTVAPREGRR